MNFENNEILVNEIPTNSITDIENILLKEKENKKCSLNLNFEKIYEYKDVIAISMIYLFRQAFM